MINIVDFDARGDGESHDNKNKFAIEAAIDEAVKSKHGETILFPSGTYFLEQPVYRTGLHNIRFTGEGAVLVCRGNTGIPNVIGSGGGFSLTGNRITFENLTFQGHDMDPPNQGYSTAYQHGRLLQLEGDNHYVTDCFFQGGNGGAVWINGKACNISNNIMQACNHHADGGGHYGAIHLYRGCSDITISSNKIYDHYYSGISAIGGEDHELPTKILIQHNLIRSASAPLNAEDHSMGIYLIHGANRFITITDNVIERADAEGIMVTSSGSRPGRGIVITNNIIRDCSYRGISLEREKNDISGTFSGLMILNNLIENSNDYNSQLYTDGLNGSIISSNRCIGFNENSTREPYGINLQNSPHNNLIVNNVVTGQWRGITFNGQNSIFSGNTVSNCVRGVSLNYCVNSNYSGNIISKCGTLEDRGPDSSPICEFGNQLFE